MRLPEPPAAGPGPADLAALLRLLQADPRPRLTWYGPEGARVELTGRVLVTWVAKTAHLLLEEADVVPGSRVAVRLGADWRAPVFWLAAGYLGAEVLHATVTPVAPGTPALPGAPAADVEVVGQDEVLGADGPAGPAGPAVTAPPPTSAVRVVVPHEAVAAPLPGLPAGCVDYGGEVSGFPDVLPAPGPQARLAPADGAARRELLGPGATPAQVLGTWAAGGSVVLHTGLPAEALARVAAQERTDA